MCKIEVDHSGKVESVQHEIILRAKGSRSDFYGRHLEQLKQVTW